MVETGEGSDSGRDSSTSRGDPPGRRFRVWASHNDFQCAWVIGNGWNVKIDGFTDTMDLFRDLNGYRWNDGWFFPPEVGLHHRVEKLGVVAHGDPGVVLAGPTMDNTNLSSTGGRWQIIGTEFLTSNGQLIFFSCDAAAGSVGTDLLIALSNLIPGRTIIGFVSYGFIAGAAGAMGAPNATGNVTDTLLTSRPSDPPPAGSPRFSVNANSAKHARNGAIVRWPDPAAMWREYERLYETDARRIRFDAAAHNHEPAVEYMRRKLQIDEGRNPNARRLNNAE